MIKIKSKLFDKHNYNPGDIYDEWWESLEDGLHDGGWARQDLRM